MKLTALCTTACFYLSSLFLQPHLDGFPKTQLISPNISEEAVLESAVSLHDYRDCGLRVEPAYIREKLIIHNYGHGGASLALSWGSVYEAFEYLQIENLSGEFVFDFNEAAILGAGVIGLTTANFLLDRGYQVHIYAEKFPPHITHDIFEGLWWPSAVSFGHSRQEKAAFKRILKRSYSDFKAVADKHTYAGVKHAQIYKFDLANTHQKDPVEDLLSPGISVSVTFDNGTRRQGVCYDTLHIEPDAYVHSLFERVLKKGAVFHHRLFRTKDELCELDQNVIFNCLGKGSKKIFDDPALHIVRHQTVSLLPQPGVDYMLKSYGADNANSMTLFALDDRIVLGGDYQFCNEDPAVDFQHTASLLKAAGDFFNP